MKARRLGFACVSSVDPGESLFFKGRTMIEYRCRCGAYTTESRCLPSKPPDQCLKCYTEEARKRASDTATDRLIADAEAMLPEDPEPFDEFTGPCGDVARDTGVASYGTISVVRVKLPMYLEVEACVPVRKIGYSIRIGKMFVTAESLGAVSEAVLRTYNSSEPIVMELVDKALEDR